jgi:hypothetical protein
MITNSGLMKNVSIPLTRDEQRFAISAMTRNGGPGDLGYYYVAAVHTQLLKLVASDKLSSLGTELAKAIIAKLQA